MPGVALLHEVGNRKANRAVSLHNRAPVSVTFTELTPEYLESRDEEVQKLSIDLDDDEQQVHDILKKWKIAEPSETPTPNKAPTPISPPKLEPNAKLESGRKLPARYKIDERLVGVPLEDIDPYYRKSRSVIQLILLWKITTLTIIPLFIYRHL